MTTLRIHKAQDIGHAFHVESLTIILDEPIPGMTDNLDEFRAAMAAEASKLADALGKTLPGGVLDHLTAELMRRHVSLFVVPKHEAGE